MKKILRTFVTVMVLLIAFVFYMKWFNAPLAKTASNFIFQAEVQKNKCDVITGNTLSGNEVMLKLENLEEHMNTLENLIELQNAETTPNQYDTTTPEETTPKDTEPTEDELFKEFQAWRAENK